MKGNLEIKKIEELSVIERIYKEDDGYLIESSEQPDFIVSKSKNNKFGVEVTKLYYNLSSGLLHEKPELKRKFLKNGIPRKNKKDLGIHKIFVSIDGSYHYLTDDIGLDYKKYDDYIDALVRTIDEKNYKAKKYQELDYYELFIDDKENFLFWKDKKEIELLLNSEKLKMVIQNSPYKRIYLFTYINQEETLTIFGDVTSGPLGVSKEEILQQQQYFKKLFSQNRKEDSNETKI